MSCTAVLRDGSKIDNRVVVSIYGQLKNLKGSDREALWSLVQDCQKTAENVISSSEGRTSLKLRNRGLVDHNGMISSKTRAVVLNSILDVTEKTEGACLVKLRDPRAETQPVLHVLFGDLSPRTWCVLI